MNQKRILMIAFNIVIMIMMIITTALSEPLDGIGPTSGTCGETMSWSLENDVLYITGTGPMADFSRSSVAPWETRKSSIKTIVMADGITSIGRLAFSGCNLDSITFPDTLTSIGGGAFSNGSISSFSLPDGLERIEVEAFYKCSIGSIVIPDSVTYLGSSAFSYVSGLRSVTIPASVTNIPSSCFYCAFELRNVKISNGITTIESNAFCGCLKLTSIELPETITTIESSAFELSTALQEVHYAGTQEQSSAISIGINNIPLTNATWYCKPDINKLNVLKLPADLTRIEPYAFEGIAIEAAIISDGVLR